MTEKSGVKNAIVVYDSKTGNTQKVAQAIEEALAASGVTTTLKLATAASDEDLHDYDLVFIGSPVFQWMVSEDIRNFINKKLGFHGKRGDVKLNAPKLPGKGAVAFCTYGSPFTGRDSAIPCVKWMGQFLRHIGFDVVGEWYVIGEFHGNEERSTKGPLGDTRGRPNQADLDEIKGRVGDLVAALS